MQIATQVENKVFQALADPSRRWHEVFTIAEVWQHLIRRAVVLFADGLPTLQLHHGSADDVVQVSQAESLIAAMAALGRAEGTAPAPSRAGGPPVGAQPIPVGSSAAVVPVNARLRSLASRGTLQRRR